MKVKSDSFEHNARISLYLVPETEVENQLLISMWKHGRLATCYPDHNKIGDNDFAITTKKKES